MGDKDGEHTQANLYSGEENEHGDTYDDFREYHGQITDRRDVAFSMESVPFDADGGQGPQHGGSQTAGQRNDQAVFEGCPKRRAVEDKFFVPDK